jgi:hypothetical protein
LGLSFDKIFTTTNVQTGNVLNTISNLYITFTIPGIYTIGRLKECRNKEKTACPKESKSVSFNKSYKEHKEICK